MYGMMKQPEETKWGTAQIGGQGEGKYAELDESEEVACLNKWALYT